MAIPVALYGPLWPSLAPGGPLWPPVAPRRVATCNPAIDCNRRPFRAGSDAPSPPIISDSSAARFTSAMWIHRIHLRFLSLFPWILRIMWIIPVAFWPIDRFRICFSLPSSFSSKNLFNLFVNREEEGGGGGGGGGGVRGGGRGD